MVHGSIKANGVGDSGGGGVKEKSSSTDAGGPEERVWEGDLGEDEKWVGVGGDAVVGEAAKEAGDEKVAAVKAKAEDASMGLAELAGAGGGIEGGGEEGLESGAGEERGKEGVGGGGEKDPGGSIGPGGGGWGCGGWRGGEKEAGDEKVASMHEGRGRGCSHGLAELAGVGGGIEGNGEEGLESEAGEERGRKGGGGGERERRILVVVLGPVVTPKGCATTMRGRSEQGVFLRERGFGFINVAWNVGAPNHRLNQTWARFN